jgi:hypothetical protein
MHIGRCDHVVVLPGILGSALRYSGLGPHKNLVERLVWSGDVSLNLETLAVFPERLTAPLEPLFVIRDFSYLGFTISPAYGPLIDHLETLGFSSGQTATLFPYDWRRDNLETSALLVDLLTELVRSGRRKIGIVAHSMGCLVARLALKTVDSDVRNAIGTLIQIAPPVRGSVKAYYTLSTWPALHPALDTLIHVKNLFQPRRLANLLSTLRTFDSLYQLLPPHQEQVLRTSAGESVSALDDGIWPHETRHRVRRARTIFDRCCGIGVKDIRTVYGISRETDSVYLLNEDHSVRQAMRPGASGDGRVTDHSAVHDSPVSELVAVTGSKAVHHALPYSTEALQAVSDYL